LCRKSKRIVQKITNDFTFFFSVKKFFSIGEEEGKMVGYLLNNPFTISTQKSILLTEEPQFDSNDSTVEITMSPWILLTSDKAVPIKPDWVVTVVEPLESVKQMYEDRLNAFTEQDDQSTPAEG